MDLIRDLFDLSASLAGEWLAGFEAPWDALDGIRDMILRLGAELPKDEYDHPAEDVWIHKTARVAPTAFIGGPCIIGEKTEVRHGAFIRGSALVGRDCTVGNSVELKNVIFFDGTEAPHYNYVGDSILGRKAHMGAGSITSNLRSDKRNITVHLPEGDIATGRRKMGAMVGDGAEIGANAVLNPGSIVYRGAQIYPLTSVRGFVPENSILKSSGEIVKKR